MQNENAIIVENVSKTFRIYDRPVDRVKEIFNFTKKKYYTDYTALRDISFKVKKGEFIGIVGKNGAGKSTLLRLLSGELVPTTGKVSISGKISLLQLAVGFDKELTGIENARFASKLLGYTDKEIDGLIEEIISFADIGEFMYHPVKTYSSGMYSRLSFAVGININPDILIADEILAVGDMKFTQKCLRKMEEFKEKGKTMILVTHSPEAVKTHCNRAIWIKDGTIYLDGDPKEVTTHFINFMLFDKLPSQNTGISRPQLIQKDYSKHDWLNKVSWDSLLDKSSYVGTLESEIVRFSLCTEDFEKASVLQGKERLFLIAEIVSKVDIDHPSFGWILYDDSGKYAIHSNTDIAGATVPKIEANSNFFVKFEFILPPLKNGDYIFSLSIRGDGEEMHHRIQDIIQIKIYRDDIKSLQVGYVIVEEEKAEFITN